MLLLKFAQTVERAYSSLWKIETSLEICSAFRRLSMGQLSSKKPLNNCQNAKYVLRDVLRNLIKFNYHVTGAAAFVTEN